MNVPAEWMEQLWDSSGKKRFPDSPRSCPSLSDTVTLHTPWYAYFCFINHHPFWLTAAWPENKGLVSLHPLPATSAPSCSAWSGMTSAVELPQVGINGVWMHSSTKSHLGGTLRLCCTEGQRAPLGDLFPYLDPHNFFSLPLQKRNLINHQEMPHMLTRKNHYLHIFCMHTTLYLHYKCHKHVLESVCFIFSRWQKSSFLQLFLKTYFYLSNGVLLNNGTHKQVIMLWPILHCFNWLPKTQRSDEFCLQDLFFSLLHGVTDAHKNYVEWVVRCGSIFFHPE